MLIPGTAGQILAIVLLILPGFVFTAVRSRLRGPTPSDGDIGTRVLTSIAFGLILDAVYVLCLGRFLTDRLVGSPARRDELSAHPRTTVLTAIGLLVVVPIVLAWLDEWRSRTGRLRYKGGYNQTPTAWDFAGPTRGGVFVRIRQPSGAWAGGWVGDQSYLSTWPEARDLFVETQWR